MSHYGVRYENTTWQRQRLTLLRPGQDNPGYTAVTHTSFRALTTDISSDVCRVCLTLQGSSLSSVTRNSRLVAAPFCTRLSTLLWQEGPWRDTRCTYIHWPFPAYCPGAGTDAECPFKVVEVKTPVRTSRVHHAQVDETLGGYEGTRACLWRTVR